MLQNAATYLQIFGIGFSFGLAGPCLLTCAPLLVAYIGGRKVAWKQSLIDISIFLLGRLSAYLILGYLAGLSAAIIRRWSISGPVLFLRPLGGVIILLLGIYVWSGKEPISWLCKCRARPAFGSGSLFILGFILGIYPCAPLLALLLEIALIAKTAWQGMYYALWFGLGTLISGFIVIGTLSGIFTYLPAKVFSSPKSNLIFRIICACFLICLGLGMLCGSHPFTTYKTGALN